MVREYLNNLQKVMDQGDAREESYYKHLETLLLQFADKNDIKKIHVTILPKKTEAGNPDFRVWDGKHHVTGYIEAKDPSIENLDRVANSEQLSRYRSTFPNVILTNFYEFRLYRDGELIAQAMIGRPFIAKKLKTTPPVENEKALFDLLNKFFSFSLPNIRTAKSLALELAKRTRFLRDEVVSIELEEEEKNGHKPILGFFEAFKTYLIGTLTKKQFADLYAQTITYGLFAARSRAENVFNRELAFKYIPNTIGILRDVFRFISLEEPPKSLQIIVDDIAEVLHMTDVNGILQHYYREGKGKDPIMHFYETFLAAYDPKIRERRGVYYTPEPVVRYIIRSIHLILKSHFGLADGLASPGVTLLDPAGGTLTFPAEAIKLAIDEYTQKYGDGGKNRLIKDQILKNFFAFELMMAPYAIGHLKMSFLFEELGYQLGDDERFQLYLTNTLEMEDLAQINIPGLSSLSEESHLARLVKKDQPVLVILGNPPYSYDSPNRNEWTEQLLKETIDGAQSYYEVDDQPLGEKNPKGLQDDYVKFLRFAQWKIHKVGFGVVGMITNHSYLDNPTFRGMRQSLMRTFNEIYVLDLHGNGKKKEIAPDGGKDENVFDIVQGTAIALFIKQKDKTGCQVHHLDLFGLRESKYKWLDTHALNVEDYQSIQPETPWHFFVSRKTDHIKYYEAWKKISDIFPIHNAGLYTARDNLAIKWSEVEMWNTLMTFSKLDPELAREAYKLGKDVRDWKISLAQKDLKDSGMDRDKIVQILYRPFEIRYTYYTGRSRGFICMPRPEIMHHMFKENIGLALSKRVEGNKKWEHVFISETIINNHSVSLKETNYLFPLYLYPDSENKDLLSIFQTDKKPNIAPLVFDKLKIEYGRKPEPEEIFYYIYGVFYSNIYREKYLEFLKIDFPHVPFTADVEIFEHVSKLGCQLADLHLMKSKLLDNPVSKYQGPGENDRIENITYREKEQCVAINKDKYFDGITPDLWNYHIGGYQVLHKYLKDRKSRLMEDPRQYCRIVTAVHHTILIQKQIDEVYKELENHLLDF